MSRENRFLSLQLFHHQVSFFLIFCQDGGRGKETIPRDLDAASSTFPISPIDKTKETIGESWKGKVTGCRMVSCLAAAFRDRWMNPVSW